MDKWLVSLRWISRQVANDLSDFGDGLDGGVVDDPDADVAVEGGGDEGGGPSRGP